MSLLAASKDALAELERIHHPNVCILAEDCPTARVMETLKKEIEKAEAERDRMAILFSKFAWKDRTESPLPPPPKT